MKKILMLIVVIVSFVALAGCTSNPDTTEWYKVTDKYVENGNHTLVLDDFKTIRTDNYTYEKIDVGDKVKIDNDSENIIDFQTKERQKERERFDGIFAICMVSGTIIGVVIFILYFLITESDWWIERGGKKKDKGDD